MSEGLIITLCSVMSILLFGGYKQLQWGRPLRESDFSQYASVPVNQKNPKVQKICNPSHTAAIINNFINENPRVIKRTF